MEMKVRSIGFRTATDEPGDTSWASSEFETVKTEHNRITGFKVLSATSLFAKDSQFYSNFSVEETPFVPIERVSWLAFDAAAGWIKIS